MRQAKEFVVVASTALTGLALLAAAGFGVYLGARKALADIESQKQLVRIADALERAYPERAALPRPSLLHDSDLKPIPEPDIQPCADSRACSEFDKTLSRAVKVMDNRFSARLSLPTLGGTARE